MSFWSGFESVMGVIDPIGNIGVRWGKKKFEAHEAHAARDQADLDYIKDANEEMASKQFNLSLPALSGATSYLMSEHGGQTIDKSGKYAAAQTDAMEGVGKMGQIGSYFGDVSNAIGGQATREAIGVSGVGQTRALSAVDEMNRLTSLLGSHGLKTTNLGQEAGAQSIQAFSMVPRNQTLSTIAGVAGAGAAAYGAIEPYFAKRPQTTTIAPTESRSYAGSDQSYFGNWGP